jgi:hypothetical protein
MKKADALPDGLSPRLLSTAQAAAFFGLSAGLFRREFRALPTIKVGARVLYDLRVLENHADRLSGLRGRGMNQLHDAWRQRRQEGKEHR